MRSRKNSSASFRYLVARLRPLARPVFWAPSIVMVLLVLFTWDLWSRTSWFSSLGINPTGDDSEEEITPEEQAIGADIDSLPMLINAFGLSGQVSINAAGTPVPSSQGTQNSTAANASTGVPIPGSGLNTPAGAPNALFSAIGQGSGSLSGLGVASLAAGTGTIGNPAPNSSALPTNVLANAMAQLSGGTSTGTSGSSSLIQVSSQTPSAQGVPGYSGGTVTSQVNPAMGASVGTSGSSSFYPPSGPSTGIPVNSPYPNSYTNLVQPQITSAPVPLGAPAGMPIPVTIPNNQPIPSATGSSGLSSIGQTPGQSGGTAPAAAPIDPATVQPAPLPPFSAPRSVGGGQINTFSNP